MKKSKIKIKAKTLKKVNKNKALFKLLFIIYQKFNF